MKNIDQQVRKVPRYLRFAIIAVAGIFVNLLLALLLLWIIYPEWGKRAKIIVTLAIIALVAYNVIFLQTRYDMVK